MLTVEKLLIPLGDERQLKAETFKIESGFWALVGANGSGKSSFLNALLGVKQHLSGHISINNKLIEHWSAQEFSKIVSVVYTKPSVFGNYTVYEIIKLGRLPYSNAFGLSNSDDKDIIDRAIQTLKIQPLSKKFFNNLSDGEKQLVMIARALAQDTPFIILDEPTAFLDILNRQIIIKLLKQISLDFDKTILFSTHDISLIPTLCDGLLWIENSHLKMSQKPEEFNAILSSLFSI